MTEKPLHVRVAEALGWTNVRETRFHSFGWLLREWRGNPPGYIGGDDSPVPAYDGPSQIAACHLILALKEAGKLETEALADHHNLRP